MEISAPLIKSNVPLSFWGGVDPYSGNIIDQHHPLVGENISNKILALPSSRGSCSGSGVLLELLEGGLAPSAIIFCEKEEVLFIGALIAELFFDRFLPLYLVSRDVFDQLQSCAQARINGDELSLSRVASDTCTHPIDVSMINHFADQTLTALDLTNRDKQILDGRLGKAAQVAMQVVTRMAIHQNAHSLLSIKQAHIDSCVYNGLSSLRFAKTLLDLGAKVAVPTTLNALSVDHAKWRTQGVPSEIGSPSAELGDTYMAMGANLSYTCAPYLLESAPKYGDQIVWAESNAVAFANSVIGARTQKYPDFLDICVAITGRAPNASTHLLENRRPNIVITVDAPEAFDDAFWPLLGYLVGQHAEHDIPLVQGLEKCSPSRDDLKAFSAAFATTSSMPMFHIFGITPEAIEHPIADKDRVPLDIPHTSLNKINFKTAWQELNSAEATEIDMVCLGNPHFSYTECEKLAGFCQGKQKAGHVTLVVTLGRSVMQQCQQSGIYNSLTDFGVQFVNDTCWCMIQEPIIPASAKVLMTNSGKYAHYGPGLINRPVHFGSLHACVLAACTGKRDACLPDWLI